MLLAKRTQVYSVQEFLNEDEVKKLNQIDKAIGHIKRNKVMYLKLVCSIAFCLFVLKLNIVFAGGKAVEVMATGEALSFAQLMSMLEKLGKLLIKSAVKGGRIIIILLMIYAIVKDAFEGANHRIGNKFLFFIILLILVSIAPYLEGIIDSIIKGLFEGGI